MAFWSSFASFFSGPTTRSPGIQDFTPASGRLTTRSVTPETAMQLSAVFACVRLIAETVSGLPIIFYRAAPDGASVPDFEHSLYRLLKFKPNKYQTRVEFFETIVMQLALQGNAYVQKQLDGKGRLVGLLPLMNGQTATVLDTKGMITYQHFVGGNVIVFAAESIWHVKLFGNGVIGMSPMDNARNSLGVAMAAEERVSKLANSGFKPSGVLMLDKVLKPEQREQIRQSFKDLTESGEDTLKILEAGMKYEQTSLSPKDVQFLESRRFQLEDIARFFGVPSVLINDTTASTVWGSGIQQIIEGFYKFTIRPYLERIEVSLSCHLLDPNERWKVEAQFDFSALLRGDTKARYEGHQAAVQNGLKTPNECRMMEGDPALPGGDKLYMQGQMTPLEILSQGRKEAPNEPTQPTSN